ncbi:MAG: crossover junction endodeoxyribonuclease RuvC [Candidatus Taylorbacteria bacterium RIFCSPHIGHO2_02_49_25]|uniref:Crossover junction endodeoxyribonuclease RuvC n=1 Tax=Candidatus Taylorbacteria bacterium RIFCSPHIGHO2_02_49_25 TaxID=1802305 RepID=A0A1G2MIR8_9BACT|nr:MAG: Crossover junction endodeoxyribonuclease RuvC [Parcubacteria group bacterium GW2011_GWF2_50_9]OHA20709.1 MAG: crossover junction endodeoxyribonuclease RuvC [Candidatus Taylorbacteria bacterium RIFCSPHIGHO2_01_FULL_49_60]OHA23049.1 MAG: crossover junction endodeoxyribonuclease RuvC [Candidatus Taylorbacteria bacterium RIFCSPHIGHO2_02_49_25]OHA35302.1 MAG: crossover junction endodeoxyribonuclease RuvC [Candidatus Taylorbacteria bacterium RIFCSPLOWO2_01_FULL_50_130]OHA36386.1 MAG: crossove
MRVLAIDPGYNRLGVAVLEKLPGQKEMLLYSACVQTAKELSHANRLLNIATAIRKVADEFKPEAVALETLFFTTNRKTAISVAEARGAILVEAARAQLPIHEYTPLQIKVAVTGYGKSDKRQVTQMIKKLIALPEKKRFDDEYDAIAVGLTCLASERAGTNNWNK